MVTTDSAMNSQLDTAPQRHGNYTDLKQKEYNQLEYLNLAIFNKYILYLYIFYIFVIFVDRRTVVISVWTEVIFKYLPLSTDCSYTTNRRCVRLDPRRCKSDQPIGIFYSTLRRSDE